MIYRCLIIDTDEKSRNLLNTLIRDFEEISVLDFADNVDEAIDKINHFDPNLIFIDPDLAEDDSTTFPMEIIYKLPETLVVITTVKKEISFKLFETNFIDYIKKPISDKKIKKTLRKLRKIEIMYTSNKEEKNETRNGKLDNKIQKVIVDNGKNIGFIDLKDILFFKADHKYTIVHTSDGAYLINKSLNYLGDKLPNVFVRIHKSYLVNLLRVNNMLKSDNGKYSVVINDKSQSRLPVSRQGRTKLTESFIV